MVSPLGAPGGSSVRELVRRLRVFSTCDVGDALVRLGHKTGGFLYGISGRPPASSTPWKICGPAVTVRMCNYGGGIGQSLRPFVEYNEPGKIMIIETPDGKASKASACWGLLESTRAKALRAEGVIVSGNVRHLSRCQEVGLPLFSRGTAALGTRQYMRLGKVNEKITISGTDVRADDILLADDNGVVAVRQQILTEVLKMCEHFTKRDEVVLRGVQSGATVDSALRVAQKLLGPAQETGAPFRR